MLNKTVTNAIDLMADEFESAASVYISKNEEYWNKELELQKKKIDAEFDERVEMLLELDNIDKKLEANRIKLQGKLSKKERDKLEKENAALDKKKAGHSKKLSLKNELELAEYRASLEEKLRKEKLKKLKDDRIKDEKEELDRINELIEFYGATFRRIKEKEHAEEKLRIKELGGLRAAIGNSIADAGTHAIGAAQKALTSGVDEAMQLFVGKASKINARLQGAGKTFKSLNDKFESTLAASPYVQYDDAINNLAELVDKGIAYNIELRAFLKTVSDKVATTFDAFDSRLLKIIRIQQEDSTIYRMGAEAKLTEFFNKQYKDSSYMSDVYDSVSAAITDSVILLGTQQGALYEYNVQKWLGSLYSLGMSSDTLTGIADAINMLSTGDVEGLSSSNLLNLIVMAANKGNISYGDLLSQGVNDKNVDVLMSNIVSYWSELANTENQVVRKKYADLFGLDMSDLVAIKNVTQEDLDTIYLNNFSYNTSTSYLESLLDMVGSRMHSSELIQNAFENMMTTMGTNLAGNAGTAATWYINKMIKDATGGINIPHITAFGTGIGLEADLNSLIQLTMAGASALGNIGNVISSIGSGGGLDLSAWGATQYNSRGGGTTGVVSGVQATTSQSSFIGNSDSSDIYKSTLNSAYDSVDTSVAGEAIEEADELKDAIVKSIDPNILAILDLLRSVTTGTALKVKVEDYGLTTPF